MPPACCAQPGGGGRQVRGEVNRQVGPPGQSSLLLTRFTHCAPATHFTGGKIPGYKEFENLFLKGRRFRETTPLSVCFQGDKGGRSRKKAETPGWGGNDGNKSEPLTPVKVSFGRLWTEKTSGQFEPTSWSSPQSNTLRMLVALRLLGT